LLDLGLLQAFTLVVSDVLLDELEDKVRVKFNVLPERCHGHPREAGGPR
jgi:hypothetical protein